MSGGNRSVHPQVTDAVTQASSHVLGLGPAMAGINAYLAQAQAQSVLFANMVNQQQQQALTSLASTVRNVGRLMGAQGSARALDLQDSYVQASGTKDMQAPAPNAEATADYLGQPVVT